MPSPIDRLAFAASLAVAVTACGGTGTVSPPPPPPPAAIASIAIDADSKHLNPGATLQLRTTVKDAQGATRTDVTVSWTALDEAVASVSSSGLVTGNAAGVGRIRAAVGAITDEATLSVAKAYAPGTPVEVTADANGVAHVFTPSFGGLHYQLRVKTAQGNGLAGAVLGYSEQDGKSVFAIDGPDATWAPSLLLGSPDSLLVRVPGVAPAPHAPPAGSALTVPLASIAAAIGRLSELALTQTSGAYHLAQMFAHLGADNSACVSYLQAVPLLRARPDREVAVAFRAVGSPTSSIVAASVLPRDAMVGSEAAVADKLRAIGVEKWGVAPATTPGGRVRLRTDFVDQAKVGAQFRRFWEIAVLVPDDPSCPAPVAALAWTGQPATVQATAVLSPAVTVALRDAGGATIAGATDPVTITLGQNTTGAALSGTVTRSAVNGIASFDDLKIDLPGTYTLIATVGGKTAASAPFTVTPAPLPAPSALGAGHLHACGITASGASYCWGGGSPGLNGDGGQGNSAFAPSLVVGAHSFANLSGGQGHNCGLTTAGAIYCWATAASMLGNGTTGTTSTPTAVSGGHVFKWLGAGGTHTCGVRTDGAAYCWGSNSNGQIGDGVATTTARLVPTAVAGGLTFASVTAGLFYTCALSPAGTAYCWGINTSGQLGDGTTTPRPTPTAVAGGLAFKSLTALGSTTCGLTMAGTAFCWGANARGQIGDASTTGRLVPTAVAGGLTFTAIAAGSETTCGVATNGSGYCWGLNNGGQLGTGSTGPNQLTPVPVTGGLTFRTVAAGVNFACAIATDTKVYCWGANNFGQLGNATNTPNLSPGPIFGSLVF